MLDVSCLFSGSDCLVLSLVFFQHEIDDLEYVRFGLYM